MIEPKFNHQGISESMNEVIGTYNKANTGVTTLHDFQVVATACALGLFWQVGQSILSIACELRRFNDREEARANNATPETQENKQQ